MSKELEKAREYEERKEKQIPELLRPFFHLTPRCGWMNDPNGFSFYGGKYHMFYQYYPYDTNWGSMHWGHAVSSDLLTWENLPCAMAPDTDYDEFGCFSGSAIQTDDGKHLIVYTGVKKIQDENGNTEEFQTQCVAIGDGINYEKCSLNPVIDEAKLTKGAGKHDFRDPRIWRENGKYYIVVGNKTPDMDDSQILMYSSDDGINWQYEKTVIKNNKRYGIMWECPDYFSLDGKQVLLTSPQDMVPEEPEFHNGNGTLCVIGQLNDNGDFVEENLQSIDYGIDFYATQTIENVDGRRVVIGWLQNWDALGIKRDDFQWFGQLSFPRELSVKNGKLIQKPLREIENYYGKSVSMENVRVSDRCTFPDISGRTIDMTVDIRPQENSELYQKFEIRFADNGKFYSTIEFSPKDSVLKIDRTHSGNRRDIVHQRSCIVPANGGKISLRLILDRYSCELFVNDGEKVMSMVIFTDVQADGISFSAEGDAIIDVTMHELKKS